jgi:hypothetical protein
MPQAKVRSFIADKVMFVFVWLWPSVYPGYAIRCQLDQT